jgi:hypothetical protein
MNSSKAVIKITGLFISIELKISNDKPSDNCTSLKMMSISGDEDQKTLASSTELRTVSICISNDISDKACVMAFTANFSSSIIIAFVMAMGLRVVL